MRHAKLWFAAKAGNWGLAQYELDEIGEGFEDAVKYHPIFKNDAPVAEILGKFVDQPLKDLAAAVGSKDRKAFVPAFDRLTAACNGCHKAAGQGFIQIKCPASQPYGNQEFAVWVP